MNEDKIIGEQRFIDPSHEWEMTFDAIEDMIFIQDKEMNIIKINKACSNVLKINPKDVIGKKCHEIVHQSDKPWPSCPFGKSKNNKKSYTEEINDPRLGISLLVTVSPILGAHGEFIGAVHVAKDITEVKKRESQNKEYVRELEIFYKSSIGREERILELKAEIEGLKKELSSIKARY